MDFALSCGNHRAARFFKSGLLMGPSFSTQPHVDNGPYVLSYPSLEKTELIPCRRWCQFQPHLLVQALGDVPKEVKDLRRKFTVAPELPSALSLDEDTGMILGVPDEERCMKAYTVSLQLDGTPGSKPIVLTCQLQMEFLAAPASFTYP